MQNDELTANDFTLDEIPTVDGDYGGSSDSDTEDVPPKAPEAKTPPHQQPQQPLASVPPPLQPSSQGQQPTPRTTPGMRNTTPQDQARRRTRGISILPVRQSSHIPHTSSPGPAAQQQRNVYSGSPPTSSPEGLHSSLSVASSASVSETPSPNVSIQGLASPNVPLSRTPSKKAPFPVYSSLPKVGTSPPAASNGFASLGGASSNPNGNRTRKASQNSNASISSGDNSIGPSKPEITNDDSILSESMRQLALKESHVGDLRLKMASLRQELDEAESDLSKYKTNVKQLVERVYTSSSKAEGRPTEHDSQKDVLGLSRKVVDEIGSQIWSFWGDVRSATMGNPEFELENMRGRGQYQKDLNSDTIAPQRSPQRSPHRSLHHPQLEPDHPDDVFQKPHSGTEQPPSPRRLSPKRSIQNLIARSPSPIRMSSPQRQQKRQEHAEQRASQRMRESQRLNKKLSHLDLRAPSPMRE